MEIIPDPTHVALLTLPFIVALVGLHFILWRPLLDWLEERDQLSESAYKQAGELDQAAEEQLSRIEERLATARDDVGTTRQQARGRALAREAEIVAAARAAAEAQVKDALTGIQSDRAVASTALKDSAQGLSTDIAGRVLGRQVA